ncbi:MAG: hypothetical protein GY909_12915 [Oligoflexia bacterium]|nr:hypothetical protein [Oligoflexia bacterium]
MSIDVNFPVIEYGKSHPPTMWGEIHGESFREAIKELAGIRKDLMLAKNPTLKDKLHEYALLQWEATKSYSEDLHKEALGICDGANLSIEDFIIINNYTDFRDIQLPDEGCTTISVNRKSQGIGQTWDMHSSAQRYICLIKTPEQVVFSLVGCLGMMGVNKDKLFFGVNNINTTDATPAVIWPALVRKALTCKTTEEALKLVQSTSVTSGHNYIIGDGNTSLHIEKTPSKEDIIGHLKLNEQGMIYHTNHCLGENVTTVEDKTSISSTTHNREKILLEKDKSEPLQSAKDIISILKDHTGHPKSICSHYQSGAQDPSQTCGGGVFDYTNDNFHLWRGCPEESNYIARNFSINESGINEC